MHKSIISVYEMTHVLNVSQSIYQVWDPFNFALLNLAVLPYIVLY